MSFTKREISFPSSDGIHTVRGYIYEPVNTAPVGVVQISHGMIDHVERYEVLADYLCERGYVVAGNDHLGHGNTAKANPEDYGFFADEGGVELLLSDLKSMNAILKEQFPALDVVLMGHSMGSFLSRLYAIRYPESISGHIIHGTGGPMGIILPLGKLLVKCNSLIKGKRNRSGFITAVAFGGYNAKYPKEQGHNAWLTRDIDRVSTRDTDEFTSFTFTSSAYYDLFSMIGEANSGDWFKKYPKGLKTFIMAGDMDPVGNYGKGPSCVYERLVKEGCSRLEIKLYPDARHELFNELTECRLEAFGDIEQWLGTVVS